MNAVEAATGLDIDGDGDVGVNEGDDSERVLQLLKLQTYADEDAAIVKVQAAARRRLASNVTKQRLAVKQRGTHADTRVQTPELVEAIASGNDRAFHLLLSRGASPNSSSPRERMHALHVACKLRRSDLLESLVEARADVDARTLDGWQQTALHIAAADAAAPPSAGRSAASHASASSVCIRQLLTAGANPTIARGADGKLASDLAPGGSRLLRELTLAQARWAARLEAGHESRSPLLVTAAAAGLNQNVQQMLLTYTHPDSFGEHGTAALHEACMRHNAEMVRQRERPFNARLHLAPIWPPLTACDRPSLQRPPGCHLALGP